MQIEDRNRADGEHRDDREDRQLKTSQPVQHQGPSSCWVAVPGGILNGSAAWPDRLAKSTGEEVGRIDDLAHVSHVRVQPPRRGEHRLTEATQRQVEGGVHVQVVAAHRSPQILVVEREGRKELEVLDQVVDVVVERLDDRVEVLEVGGEVVLRLLQDVRGDAGEALQGAECVDDVAAVLVQHLERGGQRVEGATQAVLAASQDSGEPVQPFGGRDDVAGLLIERRRQLRQPRHQIGEAALAARDGVVCLVGDVLQRTEIALVHHDAERGQHFLGGRVATGAVQRDLRAVLEPADPLLVRRRRQLDVLGTEQRGLRNPGRGVLGQLDVLVQRQLHGRIERAVRTLNRVDSRHAARR